MDFLDRQTRNACSLEAALTVVHETPALPPSVPLRTEQSRAEQQPAALMLIIGSVQTTPSTQRQNKSLLRVDKVYLAVLELQTLVWNDLEQALSRSVDINDGLPHCQIPGPHLERCENPGDWEMALCHGHQTAHHQHRPCKEVATPVSQVKSNPRAHAPWFAPVDPSRIQLPRHEDS